MAHGFSPGHEVRERLAVAKRTSGSGTQCQLADGSSSVTATVHRCMSSPSCAIGLACVAVGGSDMVDLTAGS